MGRLVWFGAPIIGGFGLPATLIIGGIAAVVGGAFWLGRWSVTKEAGTPKIGGGAVLGRTTALMD